MTLKVSASYGPSVRNVNTHLMFGAERKSFVFPRVSSNVS